MTCICQCTHSWYLHVYIYIFFFVVYIFVYICVARSFQLCVDRPGVAMLKILRFRSSWRLGFTGVWVRLRVYKGTDSTFHVLESRDTTMNLHLVIIYLRPSPLSISDFSNIWVSYKVLAHIVLPTHVPVFPPAARPPAIGAPRPRVPLAHGPMGASRTVICSGSPWNNQLGLLGPSGQQEQ